MRRADIAVALLLPALLSVACGAGGADRIVIGAKNFTEQNILAEIVAQHIESTTGVAVVRKLNLGGTLVCHEALRAGQIDLYVEYSGTALTVILDESPFGDSAAMYERVRSAYLERFDVEWGNPLGFNNTYAIIVRAADARRLGLRSISDAVAHAPGWRSGFGYEFLDRPDGFRGLVETYGLEFGTAPKTMEPGLVYRALKEGHVDLIAGNSTDGTIEALDLVVLEDDRGYFPPYDAGAIVRRETLRRHPGLRAALAELAGTISEPTMRRMNYAVDGEGRGLAQVAAEFLQTLVSARR
jgi:osmoprotectant transport system substrate-binding protein